MSAVVGTLYFVLIGPVLGARRGHHELALDISSPAYGHMVTDLLKLI